MHSLTARLCSTLPAALLALVLLSACAPVTPVVNFPADAVQQTAVAAKQTAVPPTAAVIEPTVPANEPAAQPGDAAASTAAVANAGPFTLDLNGLSEKVILETVPAVQPSADAPNWAVLPEYRTITLYGGYPMGKHALVPQIFIYPTKDLAVWNQNAGKQYDALRAMLASYSSDVLPQMPLNNGKQVLHAQLKQVDFKNGRGIRYLTQYNSGMSPINNFNMFYTYQGLTSDGRYYVAAVLPIQHPDLPAFPTDNPQALNDYQGSLAAAVKTVETSAASAFTPDLARLDALLMSLEVKQ